MLIGRQVKLATLIRLVFVCPADTAQVGGRLAN